MKNNRLIFLTVLFCLFTNLNLSAWDDNREGFIFGFGIGPSFLEYEGFQVNESHGTWLGTEYTKSYSSILNIATNFRIGYAFNDNLILYWFSKMSFYSEDYPHGILMLGNAGLGSSYYFSDSSDSFFMTAGIGYNNLGVLEYGDNYLTYGLTIGGGYEFSKHFDVELDFLFGADNDEWDYVQDYVRIKYGTRYSVLLTLNWTGY